MKKSEKAPEARVKTTSVSLIKQEMSQLSNLSAEYNQQQRSFMRGLINPDLKDTELLLFLKYAEALKLSPFKKEIIAVVYNKDNADRVVNTIVTKDGKMVIARKTGELDAAEAEAIYTKEARFPVEQISDGKTVVKTLPQVTEVKRVKAWEGGALWGAEATVVRKGQKFHVVVPLSEYATGKSIWKSKPSTMIKKVALSQALTLAFPEILGGIYDESELSTQEPLFRELPASPDDEKPATEQQINTIKAMDQEYVIPDDLTFGQAKRHIFEMSQKTSKKGAKS